MSYVDDEENVKEKDETMNALLLEMVRNQKKNMKQLTATFITVIICYTVLLVSMVVGFFIYESQFDSEEKTVLDTTTITQEVDGESSEINNVSGNMYRDNSIHNE